MKFYEKEHKYLDDENKNYLSVTTLLHKFEPYKDWNAIAEKYAKKNKRTKEDVLKEWDDNKNKASAKGTKYHNEQELLLISEQGLVRDNNICKLSHVTTIEGIKEDHSVILENNTIYPEKMIWSRKYKVCGTADIVEVVNGKINIKDFKSNKKLDFESYNHYLHGKEKLNSPLWHLDNCNWNIYQLQLNLYMFMFLQQNRKLKIGKMTILHIKFDENDNAIETIEYPVTNLQKEVKNLLDTYLTMKN